MVARLDAEEAEGGGQRTAVAGHVGRGQRRADDVQVGPVGIGVEAAQEQIRGGDRAVVDPAAHESRVKGSLPICSWISTTLFSIDRRCQLAPSTTIGMCPLTKAA